MIAVMAKHLILCYFSLPSPQPNEPQAPEAALLHSLNSFLDTRLEHNELQCYGLLTQLMRASKPYQPYYNSRVYLIG